MVKHPIGGGCRCLLSLPKEWTWVGGSIVPLLLRLCARVIVSHAWDSEQNKQPFEQVPLCSSTPAHQGRRCAPWSNTHVACVPLTSQEIWAPDWLSSTCCPLLAPARGPGPGGTNKTKAT